MSNDSRNTEPARLAEEDRWLATTCLLVVAGTHLPLISEHLQEAPVIGIGFAALVAVSLLLALVVAAEATTRTWLLIGLVNLAALTAYLASRTVGLPGIGDDVGNWVEPLSFPALAAEAICLVVSARAVRAMSGVRRPEPSQAPELISAN